MAIINKLHPKQYLNLGYNVLFSGRHGVGKTEVIKQTFTEAGLNWLYFSASTLDPYVDFVGIPKVIDRADGSKCLELIRPAALQDDKVQAIFIDELNRAPEKVLNAILELIQFKSINGHKLNNLKVVWAAINPEDEEGTYSVNHLDPAHLDRFHVQLKVPFKVDEEYFLAKYPSIGRIFIDWWNDLPENSKEGSLKELVSPRRLDYAADAYMKSCRLEDFLPMETNVKKLRDMLKSLPFMEKLNKVANEEEAKVFLEDGNNAIKILELFKAGDTSIVSFLKKYNEYLPQELVEPFMEQMHTKKQGLLNANSIEELIDKLPAEAGNQVTAGMINNVDIDKFYRKGGSLENDLRALYAQKRQTVTKLANRIADVINSCQASTLERIFWGLEGKAKNSPTNFHKMLLVIGKIGDLYTSRQREAINSKLYDKKIVESQRLI